MTRHVLDHDHEPGARDGRVEPYVAHDKGAKPQPATLTAQRGERDRADGKAKAFLRIDREKS